MKGVMIIAATLVLLANAECGTVVTTGYPDRLLGADGQIIVLEDVGEIVDNANLDDDEKREELRDLGIEDEKLIEALLTL